MINRKKMLLTHATLYKTLNHNQPEISTEYLKNRSACNQADVKPAYQLCCSDKETLEHFVFHCSTLEYKRNPVNSDISHEANSLFGKSYYLDLTDDEKLQTFLDCTILVDQQNRKLHIE